jgi:bifunctional non-homologous end joining protein LigD
VSRNRLSRYRAKRNFNRTGEPRGGRSRTRHPGQLRFVVQKHAARRLHYDLRLELDGVFRSWALTKGPSLDPADRRLAVEVEDHPLDYGDFEGTIPQGEYGGGTVQIWDRGFWAPLPGVVARGALKAGNLKFLLAGERLKGEWVLVRMKRDRDAGKRTNWLPAARGQLDRFRATYGRHRGRTGREAATLHAARRGRPPTAEVHRAPTRPARPLRPGPTWLGP